jgi:bifunctional non-homologous end joining protein LigD
VIRAEIGGWTRDGQVRQTAYKGIEPGRDPREVVRETAVASSTAVRAAEAEAIPEPEETDMATSKAAKPAAAKAAKPAAGKAGATTEASGAKANGAKAGAASATNPAFAGATDEELAALQALPKEGTWSVGGHELKLTNLDKPLFDGRDGAGPITKRELIGYFARIAPTMLPHLEDRPLNLHRFPNGANGPSFWQKDMPESAPKWLRIWHETGFNEREDRKANDHLVADNAAALCWLGNQASFEIHAWTGKLPDAWKPTFAYIDIDPGEKTTWDETLILARLYRTALSHLGVRGYPKTTGKRGIQVWIPIEQGRYDFSDTSAWVERVSKAVGSTVPDLISWEWSKAERKGRARLDYTQNASIKTLVAPYSVRPAGGAPVSTPITWEELDDPDLRPDRWTVRDVLDRVAEVGDLFAAAQTDAQELPPV